MMHIACTKCISSTYYSVQMCPVYIWRCPIIPEFSLSLCNRQSPRHEGGANDNVDMEENPAYDDLKMKGKGTSL